jgi:hypothetical protein
MMKRILLKLTTALAILTLSVFLAGFDGCKEKASVVVKDLAVRVALAWAKAPDKIDRLPISDANKARAKLAVKAAGDAYNAFKDGKGAWGAFLAAFDEVVALIPVDGWFGELVSTVRSLLNIPDGASMRAGPAGPPDLKQLNEENVSRFEELMK